MTQNHVDLKNIKVKQGCFERESVLKNIEE